MKDPRASKRRKVSEELGQDEDGDIAMESDSGDVYSIPSSPTGRTPGADGELSTRSKQTSRRRSTRGGAAYAPEAEDEDESNEGQVTETPSRAGVRSSGRQRKVPQRYEEDAATPSSSRKPGTTPSRNSRATRSAQKPRRDSIVDDAEMDVDYEPSQPQTGSITRTRSRKSTPKPRSNGASNGNVSQDSHKDQSPSPEYNDGLDDLVAIQLQQDLYQNQPETQEAVETLEPSPDYVQRLQELSHGLDDQARVLTTAILEKLSGKRQVPLRGLESEYHKAHHLVEQTVTSGEGNSMLLLGSRGCGKSAIVETIISSLAREHGNDFHVVRLNGFLHTDDRLALREMWRQLGRETHTEDDAAKVNSYADTMATLLALLSHPEELFGASGNGGQ
ncbi:hypothetical protein NUU61_002940 [Penicillium alfredii]|uniref:Origin recognition complex subunit 4 n=1 Tax=Penicillium alfredii TaxID=1506179 RepID=A0A9W9FSJ8_9EURO|nr:uncharacterized protein NUU61_002940 [Penicillium alfredii]KAJ5105593.1 hypothetical protein NUU61_002940 [Penicillium alfredii]